MNWASIAKALGLAETATEEECLAAIAGLKKKEPDEPAALQSALTEIGVALGVSGGDKAAIIAAASAVKATSGGLIAMQAELVAVTGQLNELRSEGAKAKAIAFVDGEIAKCRAGVKHMRDHYIAMHMEDAGRVEKELGALPILGNSGQVTTQPPAAGGEITSLNAEQRSVAAALGITHDAMLATLKAEHSKETF